MKIIHIVRPYSPDINLSLEEKKRIVLLQFEVAKFILEHPECLVFVEDLDNLNRVNVSHIFSTGFPNKFDELTSTQQCLLYSYGGAAILFWLRLIPEIYGKVPEASVIEKIKNRFNAIDVNKKSNSWFFLPKMKKSSPDVNSLSQINYAEKVVFEKFKTLDENVDVIMIFGAKHNFEPHCQRMGYQHEIIDFGRHPAKSQIIKDSKPTLKIQHLFIGGMICEALFILSIGLFVGIAPNLAIEFANHTINHLSINNGALVVISAVGVVFGLGGLISWLLEQATYEITNLVTKNNTLPAPLAPGI